MANKHPELVTCYFTEASNTGEVRAIVFNPRVPKGFPCDGFSGTTKVQPKQEVVKVPLERCIRQRTAGRCPMGFGPEAPSKYVLDSGKI